MTGKRKSMRDLPSLSGAYRRTKPTTREQASTELARMEHEKARLEHELGIWTAHQKRAMARLQGVNDRIATLKAMIEPPTAPPAAAPGGSLLDARDADEAAKPGWREVTLEY